VRRPRVVVVGAGAIGLSAAVHAAELGAEVVVLERAHPASGSSGLSAGIFNRQAVDPLDVEVRVRAERFLSVLEREHGLPLTRDGYVRLAHSEEQLELFARSLVVERSLGVDDAQLLDRAGLARVIPDLEVRDLAGGLYGPSDGHLDGYLLCGALAERARARGVRLLLGVRLDGERSQERIGHLLATSAGDVEADVVVNAAGAWAPQIGEMLGTPVSLVSQRHQVCLVALEAPLPYRLPAVNEYVPGSGDYALYFRAEGPGGLIAGLHTHAILADHRSEDPDSYTRSVDYEYVELVAERLADRLPTLPNPRLMEGWSGLYPISVDGIPQIGPFASRPSVVAACGGGGVGLTLGLVYGQLAAEWAVLGECTSVPAALAYLPDRPTLVGAE
jgi:glycine/D-amino acid oxidase-like deaminating enzyme